MTLKEQRFISSGRNGKDRVCCAGWLDYNVWRRWAPSRQREVRLVKRLAVLFIPIGGGCDGLSAKLLPDYMEGMGAALPHFKMGKRMQCGQ